MADQLEVLRWEDPPASPYGRPPGTQDGRYTRLAQQLRDEPGRWAVIRETTSNNSSLAHAINHGSVEAFRPPGDFEAAYRRRDGRVRIYARYLGAGFFG